MLNSSFLDLKNFLLSGITPFKKRVIQNNWDNLTVFFDFPVEIRKIIYTTNLIEKINTKIPPPPQLTKIPLNFD